MKNIQKITNRLAAVALACLTLGLAACDKNDDNDDGTDTTALTLQELVGTYSGTFDFTPEPSDINSDPQPETGVAIEFEITESGTIYFSEFPASTLVTALLGESAANLLPLLGTISYDVTIGTPVADASTLTAPLTTPVLRIDLSGVMVVLITIEATEPLVYTNDGTVTFTLETTQCQLGEDDSTDTPFELVNTLEFTATKQ